MAAADVTSIKQKKNINVPSLLSPSKLLRTTSCFYNGLVRNFWGPISIVGLLRAERRAAEGGSVVRHTGPARRH